LDLDINESVPQSKVIIEEMIPDGFTFVNASPPPTSFNHTTNIASWEFYGKDVQDRSIEI